MLVPVGSWRWWIEKKAARKFKISSGYGAGEGVVDLNCRFVPVSPCMSKKLEHEASLFSEFHQQGKEEFDHVYKHLSALSSFSTLWKHQIKKEVSLGHNSRPRLNSCSIFNGFCFWCLGDKSRITIEWFAILAEDDGKTAFLCHFVIGLLLLLLLFDYVNTMNWNLKMVYARTVVAAAAPWEGDDAIMI